MKSLLRFAGCALALFVAAASLRAQTTFITTQTASGSYTNTAGITFRDSSSAGSATFTNDNGGTFAIDFFDTSSGGTATFANNNFTYLNFNGLSSAGSSTITNTFYAQLQFLDSASAGSATITNTDDSGIGQTGFFGSSTAGSSTITNYGTVDFNDTSTADGATITNATNGNGSGVLHFRNASTADYATLVNDSDGIIDVSSHSGAISLGSIAGGGTLFLGGFAVSVGNTGATTEFSGVVTDGGGEGGGTGASLIKIGGGTLTLSGANTYTGGTTVNDGRLVLVDNGTGSSNFTTNADLEFNVNATGNGGLGYVRLEGGTINGTGNLIKSGDGELWLGNSGSPQTIALTGATSLIDIQGGLMINNWGNSAWSGNKASLNVASGATFDLWDGSATVNALTGTGSINKGYNGVSVLTIGVNNGSGTFDGVITHNGTVHYYGNGGYDGTGGGSLQLVKTGTGTQVLTGSNTYEGGTTINGGVLSSQSFTLGGGPGALGTGAVIVNSGGTLSGIDAIAGLTTVNAGGHIAPDNFLKFDGGLTLNNGANLDFRLGDIPDFVQISGGNFTASGGVATFNFTAVSGFTAGTYELLDWSTATPDSFTLANFAVGSVTVGLPSDYVLSFNGSTLQVTTAIPEPATYAAVAGLMMLGVAVVRRRQAHRLGASVVRF